MGPALTAIMTGTRLFRVKADRGLAPPGDFARFRPGLFNLGH
jgi:hypothetical protein